MGVKPIEYGLAAANVRLTRRCSRRKQARYRLTAIGDDHLLPGPCGFDQPRQPELGLENIYLHVGAPRSAGTGCTRYLRLDLVQGPDRAAHLVEQLRGVELGA